jgi:glucose-6-phosphate 1-dehydrogenase
MSEAIPIKPTVLVIFGGAGDLAWRKLSPSLFNLFIQKRLPGRFAVIGIDRKKMSPDDFRMRLRDGVEHFCDLDLAAWKQLEPDIDYLSGDFGDKKIFTSLANKLKNQEKDWGEPVVIVFYLATPPEAMETIVNGLGQAGLAKNRQLSRIVLEKPFGHDLDSANQLNSILTGVFEENQIYRIDHYLGKETVQNILAFRFANALFEPV